MTPQEKQKRMALFQNMALVAVSDNHLAEEEKILLYDIAEKYGLEYGGEEEIQIMLSLNQRDLIIPETDEEKYEQFLLAVSMMAADGELFENEYKICIRFAEKLGLSQQDVDAVLNNL
ncbi:MAG: hypothetical protein H7Y04_06790, partial [Verrucomicrobia bacterium]|nr:hypothetical protein [Cytophagales bacterium]